MKSSAQLSRRERQQGEPERPYGRRQGVKVAPTPWMKRASCRGQAGMFPDPDDGEAVAAALEVCEGCPVTMECKSYADQMGEVEGVWAARLRAGPRRLKKAGQRCPRCGTVCTSGHGVALHRRLCPAPKPVSVKASKVRKPKAAVKATKPEPAGAVYVEQPDRTWKLLVKVERPTLPLDGLPPGDRAQPCPVCGVMFRRLASHLRGGHHEDRRAS